MTGSSDEIRSALSGPRISFKAEISKVPAAWRRLSTACCGVSKSFCFGCEAASGWTDLAACTVKPSNPEIKIADVMREIFNDVVIVNFVFIGSPRLMVSLIVAVLHRLHDLRRLGHHHLRHRGHRLLRRRLLLHRLLLFRPCYCCLCYCW